MSRPTVVMGLRIKPDLIEKLNTYVDQKGGHRNGTIIRAIESYLENDETLTAA